MRTSLVEARTPVLLGIAIVSVVIFSLTSPGIWTVDGIFSMALLGVEIGLIALGQTFVINTGAIDLSVGAIYALSQVIMASLMQIGLPWPLAIICGLLMGLGLGAVNGLAVVLFAIPAILVTLATMFAFQGLALVVTGGVNISNLPSSFLWFGQGTIAGIPVQLLLIYLPLLLLLIWVQHRSHFGRALYLAGTNPLAARLSGIRVDRVQLAVFVIVGGLSAVAGVIDAARLSNARPDAGMSANLVSITIVVLGGSSIFGGTGSVIGTAAATLVIALLDYGLSFNNVNSIYQSGLVGVILITSVMLQNGLQYYARRRAAAGA